MKITKKITIFITLFTLILGGQFMQPKKAEAGVPVVDWVEMAKEYGIDTAVTILQNRILNKLVDSTLNWIADEEDGISLIKNWDDFLGGVQHDVIANAFYTASNIAEEASLKNGSIGSIKKCQDKAKNKAQLLSLDEYMSCLDEVTLDGASEASEEDENTCIGRQDIKYDRILQRELRKCQDNIDAYSGLADSAATNYENYMSGNITSKRSIANTIAKFGTKKLHLDPVIDLIEGKGNTLDYLLGSHNEVENFKNNIAKGGWTAYMALSDPHNYQSGLDALIVNAIDSKTDKKTTSKIQDVQTPQKYQDKRKCIEWDTKKSRVSKGKVNGTIQVYNEDMGIYVPMNTMSAGSYKESRICLRYETQTPGSVVEGKLKKVLTKDEDQSYLARELSDVLAKALGRLTDGLLRWGVSELSDEFKKSGTKEKIDKVFSQIYQNEYDVLGIADGAMLFNNQQEDGNNNSGNTPVTGSGSRFAANYEEEIGEDASIPYVGGPEDMVGAKWNEGPELIVELKGKLEKAIDLAEKFISLSVEIKQNINSVKNQVATLDHCNPGPDFNWEERYRDKAQDILSGVKNTDKKERCATRYDELNTKMFDIGLPMTKAMNNDSYINVPGSQVISKTIDSLIKGNTPLTGFNQNTLDEKKSIYITLLSIKEEADSNLEFSVAKSEIDSRLSLIKRDYEKMNNETLIELLSIKSDNNSTYLIEEKGIYIFKEKQTENTTENNGPRNLVLNNRKKAEKALLNLTWDIWRKTTPKKIKSRLRYKFNILENNLVTEKDILKKKLELENIQRNTEKINNYVEDCYTFLSNFSNKSDAEIKSRLLSENQKQKNKQESIFKTDLYTSPANINTSILKFNSQQEVSDYIDTMYPDARHKATSIKEVLSQDKTVRTVLNNNNGAINATSSPIGLISINANPNFEKKLFCESPGVGKYLKKCGHRKDICSSDGNLAGQTWYYAKNLDYISAFSGI